MSSSELVRIANRKENRKAIEKAFATQSSLILSIIPANLSMTTILANHVE